MTENSETTQDLITLSNKPAPRHGSVPEDRETPIYDALRDEFDRAGIEL